MFKTSFRHKSAVLGGLRAYERAGYDPMLVEKESLILEDGIELMRLVSFTQSAITVVDAYISLYQQSLARAERKKEKARDAK